MLHVEIGQNDSQSGIDAPKSENASKRQRLDEEASESFSRPCGTMDTAFSAKEQYANKAFLAMLDEFMQKKSEQVQEIKSAHERFSRLCEIIEKLFSANEQSKNKAFLAMLDELLLKKSEEVQERLKMEILNHVHNS